MPPAVERTSSTIVPAFRSTVQVAHRQHSVSIATRARSSSSAPGSERKQMRRPSTISARSVIARATSRCQRSPWTDRPAEVRVQATGVILIMACLLTTEPVYSQGHC